MRLPQEGSRPVPAGPLASGARIGALDGVRALAIAGVVAYHAGVNSVKGGFLGVDTFFALSGFLITSLLLGEAAKGRARRDYHGRSREPRLRIDLVAFWGRRARRLLPALFAMVLAVVAYVGVAGLSGVFPTLNGDALATLFYYANWHDIATQTNYFALSAHPSPLLHTWSLAIEEQFYLIWPPLLALVFVRRSPTKGRLLALVAFLMAGAATSAYWMSHTFGTPTGTTVAYYSTFTRAQSILVGAALAALLALFRKPRLSKIPATGLGLTGLAMTAWAFHALSETSPLTFSGGFALVAVAATAMVASVVTAPDTLVARALSLAPVAYLGRISYGIYLWHWPVIVFVTRALTGMSGSELLGARLAIIFALSAVSYHLIEMPIRRGLLRAPAGGARRSTPELPALGAGVAACLAAILAVSSPPLVESAVVSHAPDQAGQQQALQFLKQVSLLNKDTRVLLLGDSMALTLGLGLSDEASQYNIWLADNAIVSCSVALEGPYVIETTEFQPPSSCGPDTSSAGNWRQLWADWIDRFDPDVVVYLARNDLATQLHDGTMEHVGETSFDSYLEANLSQAVRIMSARGAQVVLLTTPYYDSGEQPDGNPWPEDDYSRVDAYNAILRQVAQSFPGVATVMDLNKMACPGGRFVSSVDGIQIRSGDGVHFTEAGGQWLAPQLLPTFYQLGRAHHATSPSDALPPPAPPS
jgi:peptidoglycan/LPS O-acetylase OafA/YrhL